MQDFSQKKSTLPEGGLGAIKVFLSLLAGTLLERFFEEADLPPFLPSVSSSVRPVKGILE